MGFPFLYHENFSLGTLGAFDSEVDTESKLTIAHYATLARHGARLEIPYNEAYAPWINLSLGTADAYLEETAGFDMATPQTNHIALYFYARDLVMAASDRFTILTLQSAGPTDELVIDIRNNAGIIEVLMAETNASATVRAAQLLQNEWHCLEISPITIDTGAPNDGTATFFLDGYQVGAALGSLDQAAIIQGRLGAMNIEAGTTRGHLLFGRVIVDDTRIYPVRNRFGNQRMLTRSGHAFLGPGYLQEVTLMSGAVDDNALICYDTDEANTNNPANIIVPELNNAVASSETVCYRVPIGQGEFQRGCYVALSGTNPRALITARRATQGIPALRSYAAQRVPHGVV